MSTEEILSSVSSILVVIAACLWIWNSYQVARARREFAKNVKEAGHQVKDLANQMAHLKQCLSHEDRQSTH